MKKFFVRSLMVLTLALGLTVPALADTIRLKDGSVIHGQVVGFKDQQFTILVGGGSRGRRSTITVYMEDVESIEFDSGTVTPGVNDSTNTSAVTPPLSQPTNTQPSYNPPPTAGTPVSANAQFFQVNARVRGDDKVQSVVNGQTVLTPNNGWTNTGLVVRRGQRLKISASGRISLGGSRFATPDGLPNVPDTGKLMRNQPTGGLLAVIGDDNDEFIFIGRNRDFVAQRDGVLFLGVNEGNLSDNSGAFDVVIEAEAGGNPR